MKKYDEDQLRILAYLNKFGYSPYSKIEAEGKNHYGDTEQFGIVFRDIGNMGLINQTYNQTVPGMKDSFFLYYWGITPTGKLKLQSLQKEMDDENAALGLNKRVSTWTIIAAIAGIVAAIAALYGIWLAYHPPH